MEIVALCLSTGTKIIQVNATDLDVNQNSLISYILGTGSRDKFGIDSTTGVISVAPGASLSIDTNPSMYNVTVS